MNENASLSEKMALKRAARIETTPMSFRGIMARAMSGNCAPRAAIRAFCAECQGFDRNGVATCTAYACPLWNFRPYQGKSATEIAESETDEPQDDGGDKGNDASV